VTRMFAGASAVEDVLRRNANDHLHVLVVWEPILPMDWARPNRWVRSRISDPRVTQFWDNDHLVAKELEHQLPADMQLHCCRRKGVLWDVVALYSHDTQWEHASPDFVDGPVVKASDRMEKSLRQTGERAHF
jgi:hypothetical protein